MEQPSGTTDGIPLLIDANLIAEQALANFELIDDLREQIIRHYAPQIQEYSRCDRITNRHTTPAEQNGEPFDAAGKTGLTRPLLKIAHQSHICAVIQAH